MHNQRIKRGAVFCGKNFRNRFGIESDSGESVDGFRRNREDLTRFQNLLSLLNA
jgi:hypothetical protein